MSASIYRRAINKGGSKIYMMATVFTSWNGKSSRSKLIPTESLVFRESGFFEK